MIRFSAVLFATLLLGACSTAVEHRVALPADVKAGITVATIDSRAQAGISSDVAKRLEIAVREELGKRKSGSKPVNLKLQVTKFDIVSGGARFFAGAFAGGNKMDVAVQVLDGSGTQLADFDVKRDANPGGYGVFYDQEAATIQASAEGIVKALYGEQ